MALGEVFERFAKQCPLPVMVRGSLEWALAQGQRALLRYLGKMGKFAPDWCLGYKLPLWNRSSTDSRRSRDGTQFSMEEVFCHFEELEDPRSEINRKHPLVSVVVIAIMGILAGASGPTGIATWAKLNAEFVESLLPPGPAH